MMHDTALMCRFADLDPFARSKYFGWNLDLVSPCQVLGPTRHVVKYGAEEIHPTWQYCHATSSCNQWASQLVFDRQAILFETLTRRLNCRVNSPASRGCFTSVPSACCCGIRRRSASAPCRHARTKPKQKIAGT